MKIFEDIFAIPVAKNKNENNLDMILVANLVFSASFHWEKIFKIPLETMLFSCEVKICWANTFLKLSEARNRVFRMYLRNSQISQENTCVGVFF